MIRKAEEKDISDIVRIEDASFPMPWPDFLFKSNLENPGFVVYEENGRIEGYMIVGDSDGKGHIMSIAVSPDSRRNEVGSKLLEWCLETLNFYGYEEVTLEVRASNVAAQEFYIANGFNKKEVVKAYYIDEDAIVMGKEIASD